MLRTLLLTSGIFAAVILIDAQAATARVVSRGNPGRFYNISGITYGSMKWEREHGNRRPVFQRSRRSFFRRR